VHPIHINNIILRRLTILNNVTIYLPCNNMKRVISIRMGCETSLLQPPVKFWHIRKSTIQNNRRKTSNLSAKPAHRSLFSFPLQWRFHWNYGNHFSHSYCQFGSHVHWFCTTLYKNGFRLSSSLIVDFFNQICFTICALGYTIYVYIQAGAKGI